MASNTYTITAKHEFVGTAIILAVLIAFPKNATSSLKRGLSTHIHTYISKHYTTVMQQSVCAQKPPEYRPAFYQYGRIGDRAAIYLPADTSAEKGRDRIREKLVPHALLLK